MSPASTPYYRMKMFLIKTSFLFLMLFSNELSAFAQFDLHVRITSIPSTHDEDAIFIAGSFNNWNPGDEKYKFIKTNGISYIDKKGLNAGTYPFKFTRGHWSKTETNANGIDIENRIIQLISDTTITLSIAGWKDDFADIPKKHSLSSNVSILDTAFFMPQLNRSGKIWIYLPLEYADGKKRYPVLYMQDGQNLFDNFNAAHGEWGVDECLDSLIKKGKPGCIVIGIENGSRRATEYNPFDTEEFGKGEGEEYVQFLTETLKPFIDKHYRTLSSKENTFIAGSSLGALISYYAVLRYPKIFGKAGIFSPAFWIAPKINDFTDSVGYKLNGQLFFYAGEQESVSTISNMKVVADKLGENSSAIIYFVTDPKGRHNESSWRKWFEEFYLWVMGNGLSYQIKTAN